MGNNPLTAILIDDEGFAIANLTSLIGTYCQSLQVIGSASSVVEGVPKINKLKPDVIFLDINMPKENGFDLLNQITHIPLVVFVTAHEQHALRAMKVCAVDFLLKPIDINELKQTQIKLLQINTIKPEIRKNYSNVLRNLSSLIERPGSVRKITLYGNNGYEIFDIDNILYLSGENNYTSFHFLKHREVMVTKTLKDYEEILEPFGFMRIHKSTLVNLMHVKKIMKGENPSLLITNDEELNVSRRKSMELFEWSKSGLK